MREVAKTRKRFFSVILEEWKYVLVVATTDRSVLSFRLTTWLNDAHLEDQATVDLVDQQHDVAVLGFPIYESVINFLVRSLISLAKFSSTFPPAE